MAKRYRHSGKERDDETGLYYYGARYYAPWIGRWASADPSGLEDGPQLYAYTRGNPITLFDPDGRFPYPAEYRVKALWGQLRGLPAQAIRDTKEWGRSAAQGLKQQWRTGSTADRVELTATAVGTGAGAVPYFGDYASLAASVTALGAKPSWDNLAGVGLDAVGAVLPFVPALGTLKRGAQLAEAAKDAEKLAEAARKIEKGVDAVKDTGKAADVAKDVGKAAEAAKDIKKRAETAKDVRKGHNVDHISEEGARIVEHSSQRGARRAAEREAGMGRHGLRETREVPLREGSQAPAGTRGVRTEARSLETSRTMHHDPYDHKKATIRYLASGPVQEVARRGKS